MFTNNSNTAILIVELVTIIVGLAFIIFILKERPFYFPPSFYAIIAGALVGAAINLLTGLVFIQEDSDKSIFRRILILAICMLISAVLISYISFYLEKLHAQVLDMVSDKGESRRIRLGELIQTNTHKNRLISSLSLSWISFIVGIFQIYY